MKFDRSPGVDGVSTEALVLGKPNLLAPLTNLFNCMVRTGKIPSILLQSHIILLHKKGDKSDLSNYRPISLISHIYKTFIKVIEGRIAGQLDQNQPPEQASFRPAFSTTDHLHTLNQIIEKVNEFNQPLYVAFVDYAKAFDSITHSAIETALRNQNIELAYINLISNIYNNSTAAIKLQSMGRSFQIQRGVKQGDPLSPKLFTSTLEEIFKRLAVSWVARGIVIGDRRLSNLRFADDIVLFAPSAAELQLMLQDLSAASLQVGLKINRTKTQLLTNSRKRAVEVDGQIIHYVDEYLSIWAS